MENKFDINNFVKALTNQSVLDSIVDRVKQRRKELKLSQMELSKKSGVSYGSIMRFEQSGNISLTSLLNIANAMGYLSDFNFLFDTPAIINLKDYKND